MMQDMKRRDRLGMSYGQFRRNMMRKNQNTNLTEQDCERVIAAVKNL